MYEIVPGFIACGVVAIAVSLLTRRQNDDIEREFTEMDAAVREPAPLA